MNIEKRLAELRKELYNVDRELQRLQRPQRERKWNPYEGQSTQSIFAAGGGGRRLHS